jgi:hypothetical protein
MAKVHGRQFSTSFERLDQRQDEVAFRWRLPDRANRATRTTVNRSSGGNKGEVKSTKRAATLWQARASLGFRFIRLAPSDRKTYPRALTQAGDKDGVRENCVM